MEAALTSGVTRRIQVLVELGFAGGRTGARTLEDAREVLRFYREAPELLRLADAKLTLGEWLGGRGYGEAFVSRGVTRTIIGLVGDIDRFSSLELRGLRGVIDVMRISVPQLGHR